MYTVHIMYLIITNIHRSSANPDREAQAADATARGRKGAEGEPGPS